jgi:hypothetical protein
MTIKVVVKPEEALAGTRWIKSGGFAVYIFGSLDEAKRIFPHLDADRHSEHFTWGLQEKDCLRFESWLREFSAESGLRRGSL